MLHIQELIRNASLFLNLCVIWQRSTHKNSYTVQELLYCNRHRHRHCVLRLRLKSTARLGLTLCCCAGYV